MCYMHQITDMTFLSLLAPSCPIAFIVNITEQIHHNVLKLKLTNNAPQSISDITCIANYIGTTYKISTQIELGETLYVKPTLNGKE